MASEQQVHKSNPPDHQMPSNRVTAPAGSPEAGPQRTVDEKVLTQARKDETEEIQRQLALAKETIANQTAEIKGLRELDVARVHNFSALQTRIIQDYDRMAKELFLATDDITTMVRVRGPIGTDANQNPADIRFPAERSDVIEIHTSRTDVVGKVVPDVRKFKFNHLFGAEASNEDLFKRVAPAIAAALEGRNLCAMIDGQSNTGKSFAMFTGPHAIAPSAAIQIFDRMSILRDQGWVFSVTCSAIENHLGHLNDLLVSKSDSYPSKMHTRSIEQATTGDGRGERFLTSAEELAAVFETACQNRQVHSTMKNGTSSRSHMVCTVTLTRRHAVTDQSATSKIYFVDLAGSERFDLDSTANVMRNEETKSISDSRTDLHQALRSYRSSRGRVTANTTVHESTVPPHVCVNRLAVGQALEGNF